MHDDTLELLKAHLNRRALAENEVGDEVTVVDNGQAFVGKVQAKTPDGKVKISFTGKRPAKDTYAANEVRKGKAQAAAATPSTVVKPALTPTTVVSALKS